MMLPHFLRVSAAATLAALVFASSGRAQFGGGGNGGGGGQAGVAVDAKGVLAMRTFKDPGHRLLRQRIAAARVGLPRNVARRSPLRKISLNRLETAINSRIDQGLQPTAQMNNLAGLTRIQYVFFYPDSRDIVIAGPAEGWFEDLSGRVRGVESGLPTCQLQNFLVALRAFPPGGEGPDLVGCSIDPTPEGLARLQSFLRRVRPRSPRDAPRIVRGMKESLGMHNVRILGINPNTKFAQIMVEADYRMKLIGIGLERPAVRFKNYVARASASQVSKNAMQRWYFVPDYQCVRLSKDRLAMELVGHGVKLVGADELVTAEGQRKKSRIVNRASKGFVDSFTKHYPKLAAKTPVYAQLRVLIDMLVAAAHIQQENYYGKADWKAATLLDENKLPVQVVNAPKQVATAATAVMKGSRLVTPVGGGVEIHPRKAFQSGNLLADEGDKVRDQRAKISVKGLAKGQWWWD